MPTVFTGTSEHSIDAKLRLSIPAKHRTQLEGTPGGGIWCAIPWGVGSIRLVPKDAFNQISTTWLNRLLSDRDSSEVSVRLHSLTETLEVDAQGRIGIPKWTIEDAGLAGVTEVVIIGCGGWLEVRDRSAWQAGRRAMVAELPDLVGKVFSQVKIGPA